jgi:hypothetical protein
VSHRAESLRRNPAGILAVGVIAAALVFVLQLVVRDRSLAWSGAVAVGLLIVFAARAVIVGRRGG